MAKLWADGPYALIASPKAKLGVTPPLQKDCFTCVVVHNTESQQGTPESGASAFATEMVLAHDVFIRGLNSMARQAPMVTEPQDVEDFMLYAKTWIKCLHGHHALEEEVTFPLIEAETGVDGIMEANIVQHEAFGPGLDAFSEYVKAVLGKTTAYDGHKFVKLIAGFATLLTTHLRDEINTILSLERYDIDWGKCNKRTTDHAIKSLDMVSVTLEAPRLHCLLIPLGF